MFISIYKKNIRKFVKAIEINKIFIFETYKVKS